MARPISADDRNYSAPMLAAALAKQDTAEVALALRNGKVVVPLLDVPGPDQVRVFRRDDADKYMLLLFSSAENYVKMVPTETNQRVVMYDGPALLDFLEQNQGVIEAVIFDLAGPEAMQAEPAEVIRALKLERPSS
ncbi:SseB family protein [Lysobacter korlensis]|uniref:SseB family protein n=1 Tax=Lysobacter korlensis TaxID=553636 RepID=A0ABV6RXH2_9GAMM